MHIFLISLYDTRQSCIRTCENLSPPLSSGYLEGEIKIRVICQEKQWSHRRQLATVEEWWWWWRRRVGRQTTDLHARVKFSATRDVSLPRAVSVLSQRCMVTAQTHTHPLSLYIHTGIHTYTDHTHIPPIHLITTYKHTEHDHMCVLNRSTNQRSIPSTLVYLILIKKKN